MLKNKFWKQILPWVIIFLLALSSKLAFFFTHQNFDQDQVRDFLYVSQALANQNYYLPLGPAAASYSNFSLPPLYYYLQLAAQIVGQNYFYAMTIFIIIIESFTPLLLYSYLQKLSAKINQNSSTKFLPFCLSILYIFAPMVITTSTSSWNPNLVPFFTLLFLLSGQLFIFEKNNQQFIVSIIAFVFLINLHFQWFVLLPVLLFIVGVALFRFRQTWRTLLISLLTSLILLSPYLHYELTHQFANTLNALTFIRGDSDTIAVERIRKPTYLLFFFPGFYTRVFTQATYIPNWHYLYTPDAPLLTSMIVTCILFWLILLGYSFLTFSAIPKQKWHKLKWLLFPLITFGLMAITLRFYQGDKPDYFLYCFLPFIFVFIFAALSLIKHQLIVSALLLIIFGHEIYALWRIPAVHSFSDWQKAATLINTIPANERVIVPLNQNLVTPLSFFYSHQELSDQLHPDKKFNILLCDPAQHCSQYQPNVASKNNLFKYDLVTPSDYSIFLPDYDTTGSSVFTQGTLQMKIIIQR